MMGVVVMLAKWVNDDDGVKSDADDIENVQDSVYEWAGCRPAISTSVDIFYDSLGEVDSWR